jgi:hypothetical protein
MDIERNLESLLSEYRDVREIKRKLTERIIELVIPLLNEYSKNHGEIYHFDYHKGILEIEEYAISGEYLILYEGYNGVRWIVGISDLKLI